MVNKGLADNTAFPCLPTCRGAMGQRTSQPFQVNSALYKHLSLSNPQERESSFQAARVCLMRGLHSAGDTRVSTPAWRQGTACHPQDTSPFLLFGTDRDTFDTDRDTSMLLVAWLPQNFPGSENTSPGLSSPTTQQTTGGQGCRALEAEGPLKPRTEVTLQPRHFPQLL